MGLPAPSSLEPGAASFDFDEPNRPAPRSSFCNRPAGGNLRPHAFSSASISHSWEGRHHGAGDTSVACCLLGGFAGCNGV